MNPWCSMTRRQVFASFAAAVTTISLDTVGPVRHAGAAGEASSPVILGKANYRYQVVENWGELPPGYTYGDTAAVCVVIGELGPETVASLTKGVPNLGPRLSVVSDWPTSALSRSARSLQKLVRVS